MKKRFLFTSESVSEGHPDKVADQISDAVLDAYLAIDPAARVACETLVKTGLVLVGGEITSKASIDLETIIRKAILQIGYTHSDLGFDGHSCAILSELSKQSPDIAEGVKNTSDHSLGAGDQGMMFGYATSETDTLMPAPITYAHRLMQQQAFLRREKRIPWLRPDAKCQVTFLYEDFVPISIDTIVLSTQHDPDINHSDIIEAVQEEIIKPVIPAHFLHKNTRFYINPTGRFVLGGPAADCGLTGRKIMVDTYGSMAHHGGGAFSGKDPSKVDRTGAYMARYVAKHIVASGLSDRCEIQISYVIGRSELVSLYIETFGTEKIPVHEIEAHVKKVFDFTPFGMIQKLQLLRPIYQATAAYGHFGRNEPHFTWEVLDQVDTLKTIRS